MPKNCNVGGPAIQKNGVNSISPSFATKRAVLPLAPAHEGALWGQQQQCTPHRRYPRPSLLGTVPPRQCLLCGKIGASRDLPSKLNRRIGHGKSQKLLDLFSITLVTLREARDEEPRRGCRNQPSDTRIHGDSTLLPGFGKSVGSVETYKYNPSPESC